MTGLVILGYFIWWSLENISVNRQLFEDLLEKSGLKAKPPKLCQRTAFLEAVRSVKAKSHANKVLIRNMLKSKEEHLFGLVDEHIDKAHRKMGYTHSATLRFHQTSYAISLLDGAHHRAFDLINEKYQTNIENLNSYELRRWIMKIIDGMKNISVRDKGGIYYVDEKYKADLEKLEALLGQIPGVDLCMVPQVDTEKSKKAIMKAFIQDLKRKMERFRDQIDDDKFTSGKGWTNALKKFKELREEISFYADRFEFSAKGLETELRDLQKKVKAKLID